MKHVVSAAATLLAATLLAVACGPDSATGPDAAIAPAQPTGGPFRAAGDEHEPPPGGELGPVPIPIPETNLGSGAVAYFGTGLTIPAHTSFVVNVSGSVNLAPNPKVAECWPDHKPPYGAEGSYGPLGSGGSLAVQIGFQYKVGTALGWYYGGFSGGGSGSASSDTVFLNKDVELWAARSGVLLEIGGGAACPPQGMYKMSGQQEISVSLLDGQDLQLDPKTAIVKRGTPVKFTASSNGQPLDVVNWSVDVPEGVTNETSACGYGGPATCTVTVNNSAEIRVFRELTGRQRSARATVRVYTTFTLTASENEINKGDAVIFTPWIDGEKGTAARWQWQDAKGSIENPCESFTDGQCVYSPTLSGTMTAYTSSGTGGESAAASVKVKGADLQITFDTHDELIEPAIYPYEAGAKCGGHPPPIPANKWGLTVTESTGAGPRPVVGETVTLTVKAEGPSGGHRAHSANRPVGGFTGGTDPVTTLTVTTDSRGHASYTYHPSEFGGAHRIEAAVRDNSATDEFRIGYRLQPLVLTPTSDWVPYGAGRVEHPDVYYGTPFMNESALSLAYIFNYAYGAKLYFNDESLPLGGRLDVNGRWTGAHCSHRRGNGLDVHAELANGIPGLSKEQIKFVSIMWKKITENSLPTLYHDHHFHLQLDGTPR